MAPLTADSFDKFVFSLGNRTLTFLDTNLLPAVTDIEEKQEGKSGCFLRGTPVAV
jgi:hypothetical protein